MAVRRPRATGLRLGDLSSRDHETLFVFVVACVRPTQEPSMRAFPDIDCSDPPFLPPLDIVLDLPPPPSVNRLRRIDWGNSRLADKWKKIADDYVLWAKGRKINPLRMRTLARFELHVMLSEHHNRLDLDNSLKILIDYLRRIELIVDDGPKPIR